MGEASSQTAVDIQVKYAFYLVALVFTVLGLSIQTAKFGSSKVADAAELIAWITLLGSGLAGLSRIEMMPRVYALFGLKADAEEKAREMLQTGIDEKQSKALRYFNVHKALLLLGLCALIVSRGYMPFLGLLR